MVHDSGSRLNGVSFGPELRQKSKANVYVLQRLPLQQSADSDRDSSSFQLHQIESEAEPFIACNRSVLNIQQSVGPGSNTLIADVSYKRGLIEKFKNKLGIITRELAKRQAFCFKYSQNVVPLAWRIFAPTLRSLRFCSFALPPETAKNRTGTQRN